MKKILADESVDFRLVKSLREAEQEVKAIIELSPGISDDEVLTLANRLNAILLTEDKDFGELTYRLKKPNKGILLFRLSGESTENKIRILKQILTEYGERLGDSFTVVTVNKVRIKKMSEEQ